MNLNLDMNISINERIATFRRLAGLSQKELANTLGIKPSTYSRMESRGSFKPEIIVKIAPILNVRVEDILYVKPPKLEAEATTPTKAQQPVLSLFDDTPYTFTKEDIRIIKTINSLPKDKRESVLEFIEEQLKR